MHDDVSLVLARVARLVHDRVEPNVVRRTSPLSVAAWQVPDEPVPFEVARTQRYEPFAVGDGWGGRPWGTTWFHVTGTVPEGFGDRVDLAVDLGFVPNEVGFQAEGLVWTPDGRTVMGVEPKNSSIPLAVRGGDRVDLYVEAAANPKVHTKSWYSPTHLGSKRTAGDETPYRLRALHLVERDGTVDGLRLDLLVLTQLLGEIGTASTRGADIVRALERCADALDPDDVGGTARDARSALEAVLAVPAHSSAHRVVAVGHAHIDSAWLWPVRETIRKCARTFSNVLELMDSDPGFTFACSSAQQYAWVRDHYPAIFDQIKQRVAEGRWIPVGGMWVESDTNMPGGEALVRQFVAGARFFREELGHESDIGWLPDSFGYTAALPQILRGAGIRRFVTQKPSWNQTNVIPHSSFMWQGIDGSELLTHLPPADKYNSDVSQADVHRSDRNNKEKGVVNTSMLLFGWGDGGGGPTRDMLGAVARSADLDGSPRVELGTPAEVFEAVERDLASPPVWAGEMYLEFHRGTYTSQIRTKQGNRRSEHLLREAELWAATAAVRLGRDYPYDALEAAWHTVLLQQFHDILPGSGIAWVHEDAERNYAAVAASLEELIGGSLGALAGGSGDRSVRFNAAPVAADGVPALGAGVVEPAGAVPPVRVGGGWVLDTGAVRAVVDDRGLIASLVDAASGRDAIAPGAAAASYTIFRDTPNRYDAWDIDRFYARNATELSTADSVEAVGDTVVVCRRFHDSTITTRFTAVAGRPELTIETEVDWHERQKLLKLVLPFDIMAGHASSEIQFGHLDRPTHQNTSWDWARFETVAHRWVHVAEAGFGVAVANDSTYGHDITRATRPDGGTTTLVRESLVRAPRYPDPDADQGRHTFTTVIRIAGSVLEAADAGYRLNLPTRTVPGNAAFDPLVTVDSPQVFVESVKLAEDRSGDVIVRMYEASGGRATGVRVSFGFATTGTVRTDLHERPIGDDRWSAGEHPLLTLRPFEIVTLRVSPSRPGT
jgi:alpha-mannosidase